MLRSLKLKGLTDAEVGLVKTILRLSSTLRAKWTVKDEGPWDVEFRDSAIEPDDDTDRRAVVKVRQRGEAAHDLAIQRPLRAEQLIEVLNRMTQDEPVDAPVAAAPATVPADGLLKLRVWPPARVLATSPHRQRMAALLSRQALRRQDFVQASGRPAAECEAFLQELSQLGLLLETRAAESATGGDGAAPALVKAAVNDGLFARLRRKLGIGQG